MNKEDKTPLVFVLCMVYNHGPYLRQCLDGFVMQQTSFPFEVIVHDDASTDDSADIIREYADKYSDIIKPVYETENQYNKGAESEAGKKLKAVISRGVKYRAVCEGDDYWIDPFKLQKQFDFLEGHPDFVMCCSNHLCYQQDSGKMEMIPVYDWVFEGTDAPFFEITLDNYFKHWWIRTLTVMQRVYPNYEEMRKKGYLNFRDDSYFYTVLTHGKGALLRDVTGVYRRHSGGIWAGNDVISNYRKAIDHAFEIYRIEGDKRAFVKTRSFTIKLLKEFYTRGEKTQYLHEFKSYYKQVPMSEFFHLLKDLVLGCVHDELSAMYRRFAR